MKDLLDIAFPGPYDVSRVYGGDINESFLISYSGQEFFIKYNVAEFAAEMFKTESLGLQAIEKAIPGCTPKVERIVSNKKGAILIMNYILPKHQNKTSHYTLGEIVGKLHLKQSNFFGLEYDNFIGTIIQPAGRFRDFVSFYITKRLIPQIKSAVDKHLLNFHLISKIEHLEIVINNEVPEEPASLIHGDLWGGNYLQSAANEYYLIDPAISYSHREMDIGMTMLFGGFTDSFYSGYQEISPLEKGWKSRASLFQLYYLLVHLNLFGRSYKASVEAILRKWLN